MLGLTVKLWNPTLFRVRASRNSHISDLVGGSGFAFASEFNRRMFCFKNRILLDAIESSVVKVAVSVTRFILLVGANNQGVVWWVSLLDQTCFERQVEKLNG